MQSESPIASTSSSVDESPISTNNHLSYPAPSAPQATSQNPVEQSRPVLKERLYVGNLHPTVDEYALLQLFSKFGKVSKLDFLFHKSGPMKGKPRGYAFVEFSSADDAQRALATANDKLLRGRKLVITHANQAPLDQGGSGTRFRRGVNEAGKPTTLSMLKSARSGRSEATEAKIAKMEAKLRQMEQSTPGSSAPSLHPSLPPKPSFASFPSSSQSSSERQQSSSVSAPLRRKTQQALPALPLLKPPKPSPAPSISPQMTSPQRMDPPRKTIAPLAGVRIVKRKG